MIPLPPTSTLFPYTTLFRSRLKDPPFEETGIRPHQQANQPGQRQEMNEAQDIQVRSFPGAGLARSEEHTSELQSRLHLVCRLLLEKKKNKKIVIIPSTDRQI